ncbi:beta-ketoacyl synthase chain length factor [Pacificispira sp.]|uniref:beta-ketoacyl synthase chain length factor n=1 Tax=Pacificispira sp. TaxID=2888761 RepID=UPI003BA9EE3E
MRLRVAGISVIGSGMADWGQAQRILRGAESWDADALTVPTPTILSANERRRVSKLVRLALGAAEAACDSAGLARGTMDCVFTSALGDGAVTQAVMSALRQPGRAVSPTHFHNSVHNAMAGYWSIGSQNHQASTSLAGGQGSFGAAILKAALSLSQSGRPVLLVAADHPFQPPLSGTRPSDGAFAVGAVLTSDMEGATGPLLDIEGGVNGPASEIGTKALHGLWQTCPAARAIPLLEALLHPRTVILEAGIGYFLSATVSP